MSTRCSYESGTTCIRTAISKNVHARMREVLPGPRFMGRFLTEVLQQYFEQRDAQEGKHAHEGHTATK